jgi:hypothetical protein
MRSFLIATTSLALLSCPAAALIIGGITTTPGSTFVKLSVPFTESNPDNTVGQDNMQSPNLFGFDEDQNIVLTAPLNVDFLASTGSAGVLDAGTVVASHYVFFDPRNRSSIRGRVDFNSDIIAIIFSRTNLIASDFLINNDVTYLSPNLRGLEAGDEVSLADRNSLRFRTTASTPGDYVRVLTAFSPDIEVPAPAAIALFGLGLAAIGLRRAR